MDQQPSPVYHFSCLLVPRSAMFSSPELSGEAGRGLAHLLRKVSYSDRLLATGQEGRAVATDGSSITRIKEIIIPGE
jgi:hypothetical protein